VPLWGAGGPGGGGGGAGCRCEHCEQEGGVSSSGAGFRGSQTHEAEGNFSGFFGYFSDFFGFYKFCKFFAKFCEFCGIFASWGIVGKEMREAVGFWRAAVWVGCEEHHRHPRQDAVRFLAGHQRVHEPALQQWAVVAGLRQKRRGALPQGLRLPSSNLSQSALSGALLLFQVTQLCRWFAPDLKPTAIAVNFY
jgi:hypothetical protein